MWIRCKPTNPVPKCFFVRGAAWHTQEKVFLIRSMRKNVWKRGIFVCLCVCCRYETCAGSTAFFNVSFFFLACFAVFCVSVHLRPPAPNNHQDVGPNEGSYSPFPSHYCRSRSSIMCSFHCVSSSFSFYPSFRASVSLSLSPIVSLFFSSYWFYPTSSGFYFPPGVHLCRPFSFCCPKIRSSLHLCVLHISC